MWDVSEKPSDYLELGPKCPPHNRCIVCSEHRYCRYYDDRQLNDPTKWMTTSDTLFHELKDYIANGDLTGETIASYQLAHYFIQHRGYYRLAETLRYMAQQQLRRENDSLSQTKG